MKTKFLVLMAIVILFSNFSPEERFMSPNCPPTSSNFSVVLTDMSGNTVSQVTPLTDYSLLVSWVSGNGAYGISSAKGFTILSKNPTDSANPFTVFNIRSVAGAINIRVVMVAHDCNGQPTSNSQTIVF